MISYPFVSKITSSNPYGDRAITDEMERQFNMTCWSNGVFLISQNGSDLLVSPDNGMSIKINPGACHILGAKAVETAERLMTLSPSNSSLDRIDRIVARFDLSEQIRSIELYLKEGTPSTTPVAPDLVQASNYYEIALADIRVKAGATEVNNVDILDQRQNPEVCGFVQPAFPTNFDISAITDRYSKLLEASLTETVAGALENRINTMQSDISNANTDINKALKNINDSISKLEYKELLWENPNPRAKFSTQDVQLDVSQCESVLIIYCNYPYPDDKHVTSYTTQLLERDRTGRIDVAMAGDESANFWIAQREAVIKDSAIKFTDAYYKYQSNTKWTMDNNNLIPIKIYGFKKIGGRS